MKAVTLNDFDTAPVLREDLPAPIPAANEVLVRVHASSVNPADYAGVVDQVGSDVTRFRVGDAVFGSSCTPTRQRTTAAVPS